MAEEINVHEEFVKKVIANVDVTKPESVKVGNEVLRTYHDSQIEEVKLQQSERSLDQRDEENRLKKEELKQKKVETYLTNGVTAATLGASIGMALKYMKFEQAGHAITSTLGRTIMNGFKLFGKLK